MHVVHRFTKLDGHRAEIVHRDIKAFNAIEMVIYVDGSLLDSQMFHSGREVEYPAAIADRIQQFVEDGWLLETRVGDLTGREG